MGGDGGHQHERAAYGVGEASEGMGGRKHRHELAAYGVGEESEGGYGISMIGQLMVLGRHQHERTAARDRGVSAALRRQGGQGGGCLSALDERPIACADLVQLAASRVCVHHGRPGNGWPACGWHVSKGEMPRVVRVRGCCRDNLKSYSAVLTR